MAGISAKAVGYAARFTHYVHLEATHEKQHW